MTVPRLSESPSFLEQEIPLQGDVLRRAQAAFPSTAEDVIAEAAARNCDDWVVTGCGDSLFAGMCAELWFALSAGKRLRAVHAMELSRYQYETLSERSVVFAISHSGTTARVVEAARAARSRGAYVVAITANADSELAKIADVSINNSVRDERSNTRTASFQAVALLLRHFAQLLAGTPTDTKLSPVAELATSIEGLIEPARHDVDAIEAAVIGQDHWIFVGAGFGYALAEYGMAKAYEAATLPAHVEELEQMIHSQIFTVQPGTVVVVIAPKGRSVSRARELVGGLNKLGATSIAITNDDQLAESATAVLRLPAEMAEADLPFLGVIPLQWLALRLAQHRGANPDIVANKAVNRPLIDFSEQWDDEQYLLQGTATHGVAS